ncbi:hypothetical protein EG329_013065 [Mollisiaceae sp. DMI_Dod_QoI]|nr:hypothetical protein EG329_013065 [Helotiales sp. DMI_Dod_QoI]
MPPTTSIPRFLLPQGGAIWRTRFIQPSNASLFIRNASKSSKKSSKPLVLQKPTKFNPPSHGSRRRTDAPRYPGPQLSAEEEAAQDAKKYPNMMPPQGSFMHWFLNNRSIHLYITLSTLFSMAAFVWFTNFKSNSPFGDMLPSLWQSVTHPIASTKTFFQVIKLDADHHTRETMEKRARKVEDVQKRAAYRKAHGLDTGEGFGGWTAKSEEEVLGTGIHVPDIAVAQEGQGDVPVAEEQDVRKEKKPLKKWLGIW